LYGYFFVAKDDDHDDGMPRPLEDLVRLEAEEPLDEFEASRQLHHRLQLLRKDHARQVRLAVEAPRAVLDRLERHALAEDLAHRIDVVEGRERGAHDQPAGSHWP